LDVSLEEAIGSVMRNSSFLFSLLLPACVMNGHGGVRPLRPLELATAPYVGTVTASVTGSLMYEGRCLLFREERTGARLLPVWPTGSVFNGTSVIFHEPGKAEQPILVSQQFVMEGRPLPWTELPGAYAPFEHQCATQPFIVSEVRPAD
jgi:hypothetical protein